ncbi:MAG: branched-chain amino acid ABC transporter permease [Rhodobacteraceae bacterium]|jgi:branched-chain amino acid transport system permease protein|nr:branched-chain amino acid ABC transporter permease [Paracoccaceae bacterium]
MIELVQSLSSGVLLGLLYGIVALSFVVIYRASRVVNLAQGEVVMVGAFLAWMAASSFGLPLYLAIPAALAMSACFGVIIERFVFRPLTGQPIFAVVMASIGLIILLRGATMVIWGPATRPFPQVFPLGAIEIGPILLNTALLIGGVITIICAAGLNWFFMRTDAGLRLAAVAEDHTTALSMGISVKKSAIIAWVLGTTLATVSAIIMLSGSVLGVTAAEIGFRALPVALLGGMESVRGAVIAGVLVGMAEALASTYLDPLTNGALSQIFPFILIILVLLIRPQGLFGWKIIERI